MTRRYLHADVRARAQHPPDARAEGGAGPGAQQQHAPRWIVRVFRHPAAEASYVTATYFATLTLDAGRHPCHNSAHNVAHMYMMKQWAAAIRRRERATLHRDIKSRRKFNTVLAALRGRRPYRAPNPGEDRDPCLRHDVEACPGECSVVIRGQQAQCRDKCTFYRSAPNMMWTPVERNRCIDPCDWVPSRGQRPGYCASVYNIESDDE